MCTCKQVGSISSKAGHSARNQPSSRLSASPCRTAPAVCGLPHILSLRHLDCSGHLGRSSIRSAASRGGSRARARGLMFTRLCSLSLLSWMILAHGMTSTQAALCSKHVVHMSTNAGARRDNTGHLVLHSLCGAVRAVCAAHCESECGAETSNKCTWAIRTCNNEIKQDPHTLPVHNRNAALRGCTLWCSSVYPLWILFGSSSGSWLGTSPAAPQIGLSLGGPVAKYILGQGEDVAKLVARFCASLIPGMWPLVGVLVDACID